MLQRSALSPQIIVSNKFLLCSSQPDYEDGFNSPRVAKSGNPLPGSRTVSYTVCRGIRDLSNVHTLLHMTFGQLVNHDTDKTANTQIKIGKFVLLKLLTTTKLSHLVY